MSRDNDQKEAYRSNSFQLLSHCSSFIVKSCSFLSATSVLSLSPMAHNTTATQDKLTFTEYVDFGKCQNRFGDFLGPKMTPTTWILNSKFSRRRQKRLSPDPNLRMGEADFNKFMRLRKQLVIAAGNFAREENLSPVLIPTMSKDMDEQLKLAQKVIYVVDRAKR